MNQLQFTDSMTVLALIAFALALPGGIANAVYAWRWRKVALHEWYTDEVDRLEAMLADKVSIIQSGQRTIQRYQADLAQSEMGVAALRQRVARQEIELRVRGRQARGGDSV
jgi:hypothetical protein